VVRSILPALDGGDLGVVALADVDQFAEVGDLAVEPVGVPGDDASTWPASMSASIRL
jgi:hypothetical protein